MYNTFYKPGFTQYWFIALTVTSLKDEYAAAAVADFYDNRHTSRLIVGFPLSFFLSFFFRGSKYRQAFTHYMYMRIILGDNSIRDGILLRCTYTKSTSFKHITEQHDIHVYRLHTHIKLHCTKNIRKPVTAFCFWSIFFSSCIHCKIVFMFSHLYIILSKNSHWL
jgi:hypothetical protein